MSTDEPIRALLTWKSQGDVLRPVVTMTRNRRAITYPVPDNEVDHRLKTSRFAGQKQEVDVSLDRDGRPIKVRRVRETFESEPPPGSSIPALGIPAERAIHTSPADKPTFHNPYNDKPTFHNPYNFIPAADRKDLCGTGTGADRDPLADSPPIGHDRFHGDHFTGRIPVRLVADSPILIPDAARATVVQNTDGHQTFPLRLGPDGQPHLPSTSVKGMLRSEYEAVTNSRFGVFSQKHRRRLAFRMRAEEALSLVPARIEDGGRTIHLMMGMTDGIPEWDESAERWEVPQHLMYAAWLPYWKLVEITSPEKTVKYTPYSAALGSLKHGEPVRVDLQMVWRRPFYYWRVMAITPQGNGAGPIVLPREPWVGHELCTANPRNRIPDVDGYVCLTNHNTEKKHDERVFFDNRPPDRQLRVPLDPGLISMWKDLIEDYQNIHHDEIVRKKQQGPPASPLSEWSRHIRGEASERCLTEGTLCYARVEATDDDQLKVIALYPVMISRALHPVCPASCLPPGLRPAASINGLSPADRVFGWVRQPSHAREDRDGVQAAPVEGPSAHKGQLRIGQVRCLTPLQAAIKGFGDPGLPLAILGEPKPQQARFYMAEDKEGGALEPTPDPVYSDGRGLRGRKVYPHHRGLPTDYWDHDLEDWTQLPPGGPCYQEYRRPHGIPKKTPLIIKKDGTFFLSGIEQREDQNRSIQGWVKRGTTFCFDIDVINLSRVELGALFFLLKLPPDHYHRLGGGKPLGFGSVRLDIADPRLSVGQEATIWPLGVYSGVVHQEWFGSLIHDPEEFRREKGLSEADVELLIIDFKRSAIWAFHPRPLPPGADLDDPAKVDLAFRTVPFIAAFLKAATGFDDGLPTHYPRARQKLQREGVSLPPHPAGKGYEWFEANKRLDRRISLDNLAEERGLPYLKLPDKR